MRDGLRLVEPAAVSEGRADWMWELAVHYEQMRRAYPDDDLCLVFDIDGTILDMRHTIAHVLLAYDREHGTEHFRGLRPGDVTVHENRLDHLLLDRPLPASVRDRILAWCSERLWSPDAVLAGSRPFRGVLGLIRWFELQPRTRVALNTGRPEAIRTLTLRALNALGRSHRVAFDSELLFMNPHGWGHRVEEAKVATLRSLEDRGIRVVAVVDNEPANIRSMAEADPFEEILFLHADTIFESQRVPTPRTVSGREYSLAGIVSQEELASRLQLVWHGVNDDANLRQFLSSSIRWAEIDIRRDPLDRLVLRHDSFEETPWYRAEHVSSLDACLAALADAGRAVVLDLKEGDGVIERVLGAAARSALPADALWFNGAIEDIGETGIRAIRAAHPDATITVPVDFLAPLAHAAPTLADEVLAALVSWGVDRLSLDWTLPRIRELLDAVELRGWEVNVYGIPDLESFLEAALLLPTSVTADFNFPDWHYYGRGAGHRRRYHRYGSTP